LENSIMNVDQDPHNHNELHTERLSDKYGPIIVNISSQIKNIRISELRDMNGILRTYAITIFSDNQLSGKLNELHEKIKGGLPIGETIKKFGYNIVKKNKIEFVIHTPAVFNSASLSTSGQYSEIYCEIQNNLEYYADICEIYCPDFVKSSTDFDDDIISFEKVKGILKYAKIIPSDIKIKHS